MNFPASKHSHRPDFGDRACAIAWLIAGVWWSLGVCSTVWGASANLQVEIVPLFDGAPLVFDSPAHRTAAGQKISITRLDFLLSDFALRRADGTWIEQTNWFAFISAREGKTRFQVEAVPAGDYDHVRFLVGLKPEVNQKNAAEFPAGHPLNPNLNGLHWGWAGGYVFLALEGNWQQSSGQPSGYSYHLATDRQIMTVELPVALDISSNRELLLTLDVDRIFSRPNSIVLDGATASTHSRANDSLADQLHANVEHAFTVEGVVS